VAPVLAALEGNPVCDADASCSATRGQFQRLVNAPTDGSLDQINDLARQLQAFQDRQTLNVSVDHLRGALANFVEALHSMGLDQPGGLQAGLSGLARKFVGGHVQAVGSPR